MGRATPVYALAGLAVGSNATRGLYFQTLRDGQLHHGDAESRGGGEVQNLQAVRMRALLQSRMSQNMRCVEDTERAYLVHCRRGTHAELLVRRRLRLLPVKQPMHHWRVLRLTRRSQGLQSSSKMWTPHESQSSRTKTPSLPGFIWNLWNEHDVDAEGGGDVDGDEAGLTRRQRWITTFVFGWLRSCCNSQRTGHSHPTLAHVSYLPSDLRFAEPLGS